MSRARDIANFGDGIATADIDDGAVTAAKINSAVALGITEADVWRLSATHTHIGAGSPDVIDSNWERADDPSSTYVGTGMSQSSGVFTFPSTGKYLVECCGYFQDADQASYVGIQADVSLDGGSNWDNISYSFSSIANITGAKYAGTIVATGLVDVTNTSSVKVRFQSYCSETNVNLLGATFFNTTSAKFIRLGDT